MVYSINELRKRIAPVAARYGLPAVYIFGSYARGAATESSDVDILIDSDGSSVKSLFDLGGLYNELCESLNKEIDLVTIQSLEQQEKDGAGYMFVERVVNEGVMVYERA